MFFQGRKVSRGPITLVLIKTIDWIHLVTGPHDPVPINLGKNRGSRDAATDLVTLFQAFLFDRDGNRVDAINEENVRLRVKNRYRPGHGLQ